jgi:hypothetical protein
MSKSLKTFATTVALWACVACLASATAALAARSITVPSGKIKTIGQAMAKASNGDTVIVGPGVYSERVVVNPGVSLKAQILHKVVIDGGKYGTVVTLAKKSSISGFEIRNGAIGVFSKARGISVTQCRIVNNWQTGVMCVRNLARIEDNTIVFNGASGIQLYDVSATSGFINHNTIAYNGNHGIRVGGVSSAVIENNIIAFNARFGVSQDAKAKEVKVAANDLYCNVVGSPLIPPGNFSFDPGFEAPRLKLDFRTTSKEAENKKGLDNETIGARTIY